MAIATGSIYVSFQENQIVGPQIDFDTDTIKAMLVTSGYIFDEAHEFRSSITNETSGDDYVAGGHTITNVVISTASNTTSIFGDNKVYAADSGSPFSFSAIVVYKDTGNPATDQLISYHNFGTTLSNNGQSVVIPWSTSAVVAYAAIAIATQLTDLDDVNTSTPTNRNVLVANGVDWESRPLVEADISDLGGGGSYLLNIVEDTTPQLGGTLDANSFSIDMGVNNVTDTKVGQWDTAFGWGDHSVAGYLADIVDDLTPQLGANLDVQTFDITTSTLNQGITLSPNGTGNVSLGNFTLDADQTVGVGQDNYVLTYDNASGLISLEAGPVTGLQNVVEDTTPQLGGDLDTNGNQILADGSVAAPSYSFTGDADTGLYSDTAGWLKYASNGVEKFAINTSGTLWLGSSFGTVIHNAYATSTGNDWRYFVRIPTNMTQTLTWRFPDNEADTIGNNKVLVAGDGSGGSAHCTWGLIVDDYIDAESAPDGYVLTSTGGSGTGSVAWEANPAETFTSLVQDTTPQLGGNLDVQANEIFTSTLNGDINLAPNGAGNVTIDNSNLTSAAGQSMNITSALGDINLTPAGTGNVNVGNFAFDADQTVGAGQDDYVLTYDNITGLISLEAAAGGSNNWLTANNGSDFTTAPSAAYANCIAIGDGAVAGRTDIGGTYPAIAIGDGALAGDSTFTTDQSREPIAIGNGATAAGQYSIAIGSLADAGELNGVTMSSYSIAIGYNANAGIASGGTNSNTLVGANTSVNNSTAAYQVVALGRSAIASGGVSTALGANSTASGEASIAIGNTAVASDNDSIVIGQGATANSTGIENSIVIGQGAHSVGTGGRSVAIGTLASVDNAEDAVALGFLAKAHANGACAIGRNITNTVPQSFMYGTSDTGNSLHFLGDGSLTLAGTAARYVLPQYTVAGAPTGSQGSMIYVTNGDAGSPCVAVHDGTSWKRIALGATISAT